MKRLLLILALLLLITSTMLAGTLAYYTTTVDLATGGITAKEFIFLGEGTSSFITDEKIGPSEKIEWPFKVKNYDGAAITETDLYYRLTVTVSATEGKEAIAPLVVALRDSVGEIVGTVTGTGTFEIYGEFPLRESGQYHDYTVEIYWPVGGADDLSFAGSGFGNTIKVSALASQVPLATPEPGSGIEVLYEIINSWNESGVNKFQYQITITNNTDHEIENWAISFSLPTETLTDSVWKARADHSGLPADSYRFYHPENYGQNIAPGSSISFGGHGIGRGWRAIEDVLVNNSAVNLRSILAPGGTDPAEPPQGIVRVHYETEKPWPENGGSRFKYKITITNDTNQHIYDWYITFQLPTDRMSGETWNAIANHEGLPEGSYRFDHPTSYNQDIAPGDEISFGGMALGSGEEAIENVLVNGSSVEQTCSFGTLK